MKIILGDVDVYCGTGSKPKASVKILVEGKEKKAEGAGTGPVDAVYKAIDKIVKVKTELVEFSMNAVTEGINAQAEVLVRIRSKKDNCLYSGRGAHTDIVVGSAKAYLNGLNKIINRKNTNKRLCEAYSSYDNV